MGEKNDKKMSENEENDQRSDAKLKRIKKGRKALVF